MPGGQIVSIAKTYTELYGLLAELETSDEIRSGRYANTANRALICQDIVQKLELTRSHRLLDIGCGAGFLSVELKPLCGTYLAVDGYKVLKRLSGKIGLEGLVAAQGQYLPFRDDSVDRILIYSVLHYFPDLSAVLHLVRECLRVAKPGAKILIGDIPNESKKKRFLKTGFGKRVAQEYMSIRASQPDLGIRCEVTKCVKLTDETLCRIKEVVVNQGSTASLLDQPEGLPFCFTRQDLSIRAEKPSVP